MNMASNAMPGPWTSAEISPFRQLCWSVRRELWENRYIYLAPSIAGAVFLIGFAISLIAQRLRAGAIPQLAAHDLLNTRYELSAALIMGVTIIVGIFYSFDALYGERRDRSILFWKSLPVSDFTVVISKLLVPLVVLPFVSFMVSIATHFLMLLLSSAILLGSGVSVTTLWSDSQLFRVSLLVFYHLLTVHGLWYAPLYGWLLMVSACRPQ